MSAHLSRDVSNDDLRHFQFSRNSGLPADYFKPRRLSPDGWVYIACLLCVAVVVISTGAV